MRDNNNMSNDESAISFLRSLAPQRFRQLLQHTRFESCIVPPLIRVRPIPTKPMRSLHATTVATTASKFELEEAMSKLLSPWYLEIQTDAMNPEWKQRIITITFKFHKIDNINCSLTYPTIILSQAVRTSATPLASKVQTVGRHRNICIILMYIYIYKYKTANVRFKTYKCLSQICQTNVVSIWAMFKTPVIPL